MAYITNERADMEMTAALVQADHNHDDPMYAEWLRKISLRFAMATVQGTQPVFRTNVVQLFDDYLKTFPDADRQYHNCSACRHFVERFGGLVVVDAGGNQTSAVWDANDCPPEYIAGVLAMRSAVQRAKINGPFYSPKTVYGMPEAGGWAHLSLTPPARSVFVRTTQTAGQRMAEKRQDFLMTLRLIETYSFAELKQATHLLTTGTVYGREKLLGPVKWLFDLRSALADTKGSGQRTNLIWRAVATAPQGFAHVGSSMGGQLLDAVKQGTPAVDISKMLRKLMNATVYQRPTVAPAAGNIAQAEKTVEALGIAPSLKRRYARFADLQALIWQQGPATPATTLTPSGGVFGHLTPREAAPVVAAALVEGGSMSFAKFRRDVLPGAQRIEVFAPAFGHYLGVTTAEDVSAPPILKWDTAERRNSVSTYVNSERQGFTTRFGSLATRWGLAPNSRVAVSAITMLPHLWQPGFEHAGMHGAMFVIPSQRAPNGDGGLALFPENLRSELHGIRSTIEAFSNAGTLSGAEEGDANCLVLQDGAPLTVFVSSALGVTKYTLDRME